MFQCLLFAIRHTGILIIKEMVFYRRSQRWQKFITCCYRKHRRKVARRVHTIRIRCHKIRSCIRKLTRMRIIFNIHISLKFVLRCQIQLSEFSIYTDNRRQSPTCLVTIKLNLCIIQFLKQRTRLCLSCQSCLFQTHTRISSHDLLYYSSTQLLSHTLFQTNI